MSISQRLVVIFVLIALLPLGLMLGIGIVASKTLLEDTAGRNFESIAHEKARAIEVMIAAKIKEARDLARHPVIQDAVLQANDAYAELAPPAAKASIDEIDRKWIERGAPYDIAQRILHDDISVFLKKRLANQPENYGEIFLTDRFGATVAMTKVLSDYNQSDEQWWWSAYNAGQGQVFIDDRGYDTSVEHVVVGVVVPIKQGDQATGVLKINFRLGNIMAIVSGHDVNEGEGVFLARSLGTLIATSPGWEDGIVYRPALENAVKSGIPGWQKNRHGAANTVLGYAPVDMAIFTRNLLPGARPGISGEVWEPVQWFVFVETELTPSFASIDKLIVVFAVSGFGTLLAVIIIALLTASSLSRPIRALQKGAEDIASGNLERRVGTSATDEIGQLSRVIDKMLERINVLTTSRDELNSEIHIRKLAEQALNHARADAVAANEAKSRFLANMSHDLRTPLNAIMGFAEIIREEMYGPLGDQHYKDYAKDIHDSGKFLTELINGILDLSKIEAGKYVLCEDDLRLPELIEDSLRLIKHQAEKAGIFILTDIERDLPRVRADDRAIMQILNNLLSNAVKFTPPGGRIKVSAHLSPKGEIALRVEDTGIGMDKDEAEKALEPFVQIGRTANTAQQGTGLGLSLCKNFTELHGGTMNVTSKKGVGTKVTIVFPARRTLAPGPHTPSSRAPYKSALPN